MITSEHVFFPGFLIDVPFLRPNWLARLAVLALILADLAGQKTPNWLSCSIWADLQTRLFL